MSSRSDADRPDAGVPLRPEMHIASTKRCPRDDASVGSSYGSPPCSRSSWWREWERSFGGCRRGDAAAS